MPLDLADPVQILTASFLLALAVFAVVMLSISRRRSWAERQAFRLSERAGLPFGTDTVHDAVVARVRRSATVSLSSILVAVSVTAVLWLAVPVARSPYLLWTLAFVILVVIIAGSTLIEQLRDTTFHPAPSDPRVARLTSVGIRHYLDGWRTRTPDVLLFIGAVATIGVGIASIVALVPPTWVGVALLALVFAVAVRVTTTAMERRILAHPQPAKDGLQLAWDDLFRSDALRSLRMSAALAAWVPVGLSFAVLLRAGLPLSTTDAAAVLGVFPWWGIPALQVLYTLGQGRLSPDLFPRGSRATPDGSPA
ncbi:hypothetical protein ABXJ56_14985 [Microbacterium chocolatum]|uniref:hypothetical protein n=1 Tax=Microbacterium aurantiacum TaxID=162393 RepID=UPI00338E1FD7